jgi:hypothetical protein
MPYIAREERAKVDDTLAELIQSLSFVAPDDKAGMCNYIVTRLLSAAFAQRYNAMNSAVGVLECAKMEFYRRMAAPYEDVKMGVNGDAFPPMHVEINQDE